LARRLEAFLDKAGEGEKMSKRSLLALLAIVTFAAAVVVGLGASAAFAGEVTGNCNHAGSANAADNCKGGSAPGDRVANGNSWCSYSGQNDNPDSTNPLNPGGNTQNWGQDVAKNKTPEAAPFEPSVIKGGSPSPGSECNPNKTTIFGGPPPRK
jgi:hypothetical protein